MRGVGGGASGGATVPPAGGSSGGGGGGGGSSSSGAGLWAGYLRSLQSQPVRQSRCWIHAAWLAAQPPLARVQARGLHLLLVVAHEASLPRSEHIPPLRADPDQGDHRGCAERHRRPDRPVCGGEEGQAGCGPLHPLRGPGELFSIETTSQLSYSTHQECMPYVVRHVLADVWRQS